jgi:transcriptional regulator with XRE-family HTH domain
MSYQANGLQSIDELMSGYHENLLKQSQFERQEAEEYINFLLKEANNKQEKIGADGRVTKERTWNDAQLLYIGSHINKIREKSNISVREFEKMANLKVGYTSLIEQAKYKSFTIHDLLNIERALNANFRPMLAEVNKIKGEIPKKGGRRKYKKKNNEKVERVPEKKYAFERNRIQMEEFKGEGWTIQTEISSENFELKYVRLRILPSH